jgi:hypothetical protein
MQVIFELPQNHKLSALEMCFITLRILFNNLYKVRLTFVLINKNRQKK